MENQGLGIALVSYAGTLCWGFNADHELVPDLAKFVKLIERSFNELAAAGVDLTRSPREVAGPGVIELQAGKRSHDEKRKHKGVPTTKAKAATGTGRRVAAGREAKTPGTP